MLQASASEGLVQGPYVASRAGFEPATLWSKGIDSTKGYGSVEIESTIYDADELRYGLPIVSYVTFVKSKRAFALNIRTASRNDI